MDQFMKLEMQVKVLNDGLVMWYFADSVRLACRVDIRLFPFDHQNQQCSLVIGPSLPTTQDANATLMEVDKPVYNNSGVEVRQKQIVISDLYWRIEYTVPIFCQPCAQSS